MRECELVDLKSNMDRFIDPFNYRPTRKFLYLKSNMDRFIVYGSGEFNIFFTAFKIQYG